MICYNFCILEKLDLAKKNKRLKKEKAEKTKSNATIAFASNDSFFFDFFDSLLPQLSNTKLEALLIDINTSNRIFIVS